MKQEFLNSYKKLSKFEYALIGQNGAIGFAERFIGGRIEFNIATFGEVPLDPSKLVSKNPRLMYAYRSAFLLSED